MITTIHTRLLRAALEVDDSRAYWRRRAPNTAPPTPAEALTDLWFGPKSLPRVAVLLLTFRHRYDAYPAALAALHTWSEHAPTSLAECAPLVCHWHTQLTDPLYRAFVAYLAQRRASPNPTITRTVTLDWLAPHADLWTVSTRTQFASKLLSAAYAAGLVTSNSDRRPRPLATPRVPDLALAYALHLAKADGLDPTDNPLLASVGLTLADGSLDARIRRLPSFTLARQGDLVELNRREPDLIAWSNTLGAAA